jgi:hypothetical protein
MKRLLLIAFLVALTAGCTISNVFDKEPVVTPDKPGIPTADIQRGEVVTQGGVTWTIDSAGQIFRDGKALVCNAQGNCLIESRELWVLRDVLFIRNHGFWYHWVGGANGHFLEVGRAIH